MLRIPHCLDSRLTVNCEILATCSSTYSPVRTSFQLLYWGIPKSHTEPVYFQTKLVSKRAVQFTTGCTRTKDSYSHSTSLCVGGATEHVEQLLQIPLIGHNRSDVGFQNVKSFRLFSEHTKRTDVWEPLYALTRGVEKIYTRLLNTVRLKFEVLTAKISRSGHLGLMGA
jgi:hypothetical protein